MHPENPSDEPYSETALSVPLLRRSDAGIGRQVVPLLPFRFPTLNHLDERVCDVQKRADGVEGLQPNTVARWVVAWRLFRRFVASHERDFIGGDYRLQSRLIENWTASLRESGVARSTISTYWRSVQAQLARIELEDGVMNPFSLLPPPKPGSALPRSLTRAEAQTVVRYVKHHGKSAFERARNLCLIALLLLAGLRRGEALTLKLGDCNLERRTVTLRNAKGINGGRTRTAYLSPELAEILLQYIEMRTNLQPPRTHPELLTSADKDRALTVPVVAGIFKRMQRDLGFKVTPHMLRHTYALLLRQSGVPDRVSMDFLGHRSLAMLQRYSHVFEPEYRAESEKVMLDIDGDLGPVTPPSRT